MAVNTEDPLPELRNLQELVSKGLGSARKDYHEDTAQGVSPELPDASYDTVGFGRFSGAVLDLHGCTVSEAGVSFEQFIKESIILERAVVLIIHGRGLSSHTEPVLKKKVCEWLGALVRKNTLSSFAGASPVDGGEGATYVWLTTE